MCVCTVLSVALRGELALWLRAPPFTTEAHFFSLSLTRARRRSLLGLQPVSFSFSASLLHCSRTGSVKNISSYSVLQPAINFKLFSHHLPCDTLSHHMRTHVSCQARSVTGSGERQKEVDGQFSATVNTTSFLFGNTRVFLQSALCIV